MNVIYSSDENYAQHLCVSLVSLLENNKDVQPLHLFIISNGITETSKQNIVDTAKKYRRDLNWIDFSPFKNKLTLDMEWPISISSYARLFIADMLPAWCDRAIYLDCDTVVCGSLSELWDIEMGTCSVGGVEDVVSSEFKGKIGMNPDAHYINAGVLLIDIAKWRAQETEKHFLAFIDGHEGRVAHHDQGVINGTLHQECLLLSPQYNAMTPFFTTKYNNLRSFYQLKHYYSQEDLQHAIEEPVIVHYTPEFVGRAWEYECKHPKADLYRMYLDRTPWKGHLVHAERQPAKLRLLYWMQKNLSVPLLQFLLRSR